MNGVLLVVAVLALLVAGVARRQGLSAPLLLVVVGLAASQVPGLGAVTLDPNLVLFVVLPPLLYSAALESSYIGLRRNRRAIGLLAVVLPLLTTLVVGWVAWLTVPQLPFAAALVLGAVVAPPDAVSATAVGRRLGLPRRIMTLLGGESLLNDATALTAYRVALAAAVGTGATLVSGVVSFAVRPSAVWRWAWRSGWWWRGCVGGWTTQCWKAPSGWWSRSVRISRPSNCTYPVPPRTRTAPGCWPS